MKLSERLQKIVEFVEEGKIADIGTDHGYIPAYLVKNSIASIIIASDINEGPLNNAKEYIEELEIEKHIELRLGGGLSVLSEEDGINTAIIAGMGGNLIASILEDSKKTAKTIDSFILQPMVAIRELRLYLYNNNYKIEGERLAKEGDKYYQILYVKHGKEKNIDKEIYFSMSEKLLECKDPLMKEFLDKEIDKTNKTLKKLEYGKTDESKKARILFELKMKELMEVRESVCRGYY